MTTIKFLKIVLLACTDNAYPGWLLCSFRDAKGKTYEFEEKIPVITTEDFHEDTVYPVAISIKCELLNITDNIATINLANPWGIEVDGNSIFQVFTDQLSDS